MEAMGMNRRKPPELELRVLGPMELWAHGERVALPRSKKSRALLAYLAMTGRTHRRQRLCDLLWDVTDDPRGALRWTLSRLRKSMGDAAERLEANREEIGLRTAEMCIDACALSDVVKAGLENASLDDLERIAATPRGEFLEGLDLTDFLDFHAWCIAERECHRRNHAALLTELVCRLRDDTKRALPYARKRAQIDVFDVRVQTDLLELLSAAGSNDEARARFDNVKKLYREVGAQGLSALEAAWHTMRVAPPTSAAPAPEPQSATPETERASSMWPFVGRSEELSRLEAQLNGIGSGEAPKIALLMGEPGAGKSRLAERFTSRVHNAGYEVLFGRAYEAESSRPYGPWVDALRTELSELVGHGRADAIGHRDAFFHGVVDRLRQAGERGQGLVLVLDDIQWLDSDSAALLHFVTRIYRGAPLLILLLARGGELTDNEHTLRAVRGIRKAQRIEELEVRPLSRDEIATLVGPEESVDVAEIFEASAGNPLYAIELARARSGTSDRGPASLLELVRERVEQLPPHAADVLRWGAVLGHAIDIGRLESLSSSSPEDVVDALERLEHHALLRIDATRVHGRYVFSHDVVREAVYGELSHPRRRLMHRKVAYLLSPHTADAAVATEVAHHASLAGEALLGVRAYTIAGAQSLRVFANGDAEVLAKRGLHLAAELDDADRISATLDLLHILYSARTPDREEAAGRVRELAEKALDLGLTNSARLGFQMLSFLRWESSSMAAAHDNIMQAERVSRNAGEDARHHALAQAAKCLVLLERNLEQAEAFVLEADTISSRAGQSSSAVSFATGMIAAHRGELDEAVAAFEEARGLARAQGDRLAEFCAVEHWVMLEIDRGGLERARELSAELAELGGRVRPGAEAPAGRALDAFVRMTADQPDALDELRSAMEELLIADAKYELSFLLTRWAAYALEDGQHDNAVALAHEALLVASAIGRPSETALAHSVLADCAAERGDDSARAEHVEALEALSQKELSRAAREDATTTLGRS